MSFGRRIYDILRAQVGHYGREAAGIFGARDEEAFDVPPEDADHSAGHSAGHSGGRPHTGRVSDARREAIANAYRLLEIPYGSGPDRIRAAHRNLMRRFHPDRFARDEDGLRDATRLSQEITAARDLLLDTLGTSRSP